MTEVDFQGTRIACRVFGKQNQPLLVICHGMALCSDEFIALAEQLSDRWRVLLWDMPGHGNSGALPRTVSAEYMANALAKITQHFAISEMVLMGFSFGGVVAQYYARSHADKLKGLILHGCFAPFSQEPIVPRWLVCPVVFKTFGMKPWDVIRDEFAEICVSDSAAQNRTKSAADRLGKPGFVSMTRALLRSFKPDPNFRIDCPLLLISGENDINGPQLKMAQDALVSLSHSHHRVLVAGAAHCAHIDAPEPFSLSIKSFLERGLE